MNWDGQSWENDIRGVCTYNTAQMLLSETYQIWGGAGWLNDSRERYEYDQYNFTTLDVKEYWEIDAWAFIYGQRLTPQYVASANPVSILVEYYDWEPAIWIISNKILLVWETVTGTPHNTPMEINMYPNPVHNQIFFKVNEVLSGNLQYAIYNSSSRLITSGRLTDNTIDVANLPSGNYVLQLKHNGQTVVRKFIKR